MLGMKDGNLRRAFRQGLTDAAPGNTPSSLRAAGDKSKTGRVWLGGGVVFLTLLGFLTQPSDTKVADKQAGVHCLSKWDGSHEEVVELVRAGLREPSSFEHIQTRVTQIKADGQHGLLMDYRARNGFGGVNVHTATATYRNDNCAVVAWGAN